VDVDSLRAEGRYQSIVNPNGTQATDPTGNPVYVLDARSGDFAAGNFYEIHGEGRPGTAAFVAKIYWLPARHPHGSELTIKAQNLSSPGQAPTVVRLERSPKLGTGTSFFWPSGTPLSGPGRWRGTSRDVV
jgi:hypothetical protein